MVRHDPAYAPPWPLRNVWLGVSAEDQKRAEERIPILLQTPAAVRGVSLEPLLGPVDLECYPSTSCPTGWLDETPGLDWVIVGGESGPGARPMEIAWLEAIVEQCQAAGVPCFVKQDSSKLSGQQGNIPGRLWKIKEWPDAVQRP